MITIQSYSKDIQNINWAEMPEALSKGNKLVVLYNKHILIPSLRDVQASNKRPAGSPAEEYSKLKHLSVI